MEIIRENDRQKITADTQNKIIIRQIYDDKREIYKTLQKINHPNIPYIFNVEFDGDTVVTEEYIEGKSLSALIDEQYVFSKKQVKSIVKQLVVAMTELHRFNIIHRDIKPDNIIINESGHVWLIDYDISRIYREEIRKDTELMGTFGYAPIEQYGMMPTDFKSDIYSFGVTVLVLLKYAGIKGYLKKIADKSARLDPAERYKTAENIKKALVLHKVRNPLIIVGAVVAAITCFFMQLDAKIEQAGDFLGFEEYPKFLEYCDYPNFFRVAVFSVDEPWDHLIFIDDIRQKGKIKLGKKDTLVDADIALSDGRLSVSLKDKYGNDFNHEFEFRNQYEYEMKVTENLRKNADIICRDLDGDDVQELLVGLSESDMGIVLDDFYNEFNYCIGWCIKYDKENGFRLCDGEMFEEGYSFSLNKHVKHVNVFWEDFNDPVGYALQGEKIIPFR